MNIYAYTMRPKRVGPQKIILPYQIEYVDNIINISSLLYEPSKNISLDPTKMKTNMRYEAILSPFDTDDFIIPNFDKDGNIKNYCSDFFEIHYSTRSVGQRTSIMFVKTEVDELFIKTEEPVHSLSIHFSEISYRPDLSMDVLLKKYSKDRNAYKIFLQDWKLRKLKFDMLPRLPVRQNVTYLDLQSDLLLKIIRFVLKESPELARKIEKEYPEINEILKSLDDLNILDKPYGMYCIDGAKERKLQTRDIQEDYYDSAEKIRTEFLDCD